MNKLEEIKEIFEKLKDLKVLVIGDVIIDHYVFVTPKGRAVKDPILSCDFDKEEYYAGGILAIVNHLKDFVKEVNLICLSGVEKDCLDIINSVVNKKNISLTRYSEKRTTIKKRYIDSKRGSKLFKVEYIDDKPISDELSERICNYLRVEIPKYDLVIVGDFGHGFINDKIRRVLEEKSRFLALNVQTNSSNMGYNHFTRYKRFDFISMNEGELRMPLGKRFEDLKLVMKEAVSDYNIGRLLVTTGNKGCNYLEGGKIIEEPALSKEVKDTVGSGDASYTLSALLAYIRADKNLIPYLANCAGAIKSSYSGNKESLTKDKIIKFVEKLK